MSLLLKTENLGKSYGGAVPLRVLRDVNLRIEHREFVSLIGPSGAGKTTLLNLVSTLDSPSQGRVLIDGVDVHRLPQRRLNEFRNGNLGFIFQDDLLLPHLTALENVMLPARVARMSRRKVRARARDLLACVGLADRASHTPGELSGGQRQRVNIARALVNDPTLLLADEPTARLDQATGRSIIALLVELNRLLRVTILMVTHEREVADRTRRVVELIDGRVVSDRRLSAA
jgi:ABC-type lipoprotein export system ATPase subunit